MMLKIALFAYLAVGVLADIPELPKEKVEEFKGMIREYCKKNGAEDKVDQVQNAGAEFVDCLKNFVNVNQLQTEINEAKPRGALDEVFKKYCDKSSQLKTCIHTLLDKVSPCMDANIIEHIPAARNSSNQLIDFLCFKDGDRIALFIAEGGPECFQSKVTEMRECATSFRSNFADIEAAKKLSPTEKCTKVDELAACVVGKVEGCATPTPANMVESLFKYIRKQSPCHTLLPKKN